MGGTQGKAKVSGTTRLTSRARGATYVPFSKFIATALIDCTERRRSGQKVGGNITEQNNPRRVGGSGKTGNLAQEAGGSHKPTWEWPMRTHVHTAVFLLRAWAIHFQSLRRWSSTAEGSAIGVPGVGVNTDQTVTLS